jgi:uncharacterized protein YcbX
MTPVKGLALVQPTSVQVERTGVVGDRRFALIDERGVLANGKSVATFVQVHPTWTADGILTLDLPDGRTVTAPVVLGETVVASFYRQPREGRLVLGPFAAELSRLAGAPLRLLEMGAGDGVDRPAEGAVTLQSHASLLALAQHGGQSTALDGRRFRMTFTIDGVAPYAEDGWLGRRVRLGGVVVRPTGNVGRCVVTTRDPDTGVKTFDTLRMLADSRGTIPTTEPLPFGVHAEVLVPGTVSVGDEVELLD